MKKTHFVLILSCMLLFGCKGEQSQDNSSEKQEREYQYGIDDMSDIEAWIESHGGIDIDATIKCMYDKLKK